MGSEVVKQCTFAILYSRYFRRTKFQRKGSELYYRNYLWVQFRGSAPLPYKYAIRIDMDSIFVDLVFMLEGRLRKARKLIPHWSKMSHGYGKV